MSLIEAVPRLRLDWHSSAGYEPSILKMAVTMLESLGYAVLRAGSPEEALRIADERHGALDKDMSFVAKPFSVHELAAKVREVLDEEAALGAAAGTGAGTDGVADAETPSGRHSGLAGAEPPDYDAGGRIR